MVDDNWLMLKHVQSKHSLAEVARHANRHAAVVFLLREQEVEISRRSLSGRALTMDCLVKHGVIFQPLDLINRRK